MNKNKKEIDFVIGNIIQQARINKNMTQEIVCEKLNKSSKTLSQIENAKYGASKETLIDLMNILEISPNNLYGKFIYNKKLKSEINISNEISDLSYDQLQILKDFINVLKK